MKPVCPVDPDRFSGLVDPVEEPSTVCPVDEERFRMLSSSVDVSADCETVSSVDAAVPVHAQPPTRCYGEPVPWFDALVDDAVARFRKQYALPVMVEPITNDDPTVQQPVANFYIFGGSTHHWSGPDRMSPEASAMDDALSECIHQAERQAEVDEAVQFPHLARSTVRLSIGTSVYFSGDEADAYMQKFLAAEANGKTRFRKYGMNDVALKPLSNVPVDSEAKGYCDSQPSYDRPLPAAYEALAAAPQCSCNRRPADARAEYADYLQRNIRDYARRYAARHRAGR